MYKCNIGSSHAKEDLHAYNGANNSTFLCALSYLLKTYIWIFQIAAAFSIFKNIFVGQIINNLNGVSSMVYRFWRVLCRWRLMINY